MFNKESIGLMHQELIKVAFNNIKATDSCIINSFCEDVKSNLIRPNLLNTENYNTYKTFRMLLSLIRNLKINSPSSHDLINKTYEVVKPIDELFFGDKLNILFDFIEDYPEHTLMFYTFILNRKIEPILRSLYIFFVVHYYHQGIEKHVKLKKFMQDMMIIKDAFTKLLSIEAVTTNINKTYHLFDESKHLVDVLSDNKTKRIFSKYIKVVLYWCGPQGKLRRMLS